MKRKLAVLLAVLMTFICLGGCSGNEKRETAGESGLMEAQEQTQSDTVILVVSFGTSYNDSRDVTIGAIETAIAEAFPEYETRRAFTSQIIIDKLKERDGLEIDNVEEALDRAVSDGVKELIVQPTHLMDGYEYTDLAKALTDYVDRFDKIILSKPLLSDEADFDAIMSAITEKTASYDDGETAICFMGHGTEADSNGVYEKLARKLWDNGYENYYIGTVEAQPSLDDVLASMEGKGYRRVVLEPLMVVAGDHANNDMAGDEEGSWKTILTQKGYEVECVMEGLGQIPAVRDRYVEHVKTAVSLDESFAGVDTADSGNTGNGEVEDGVYSVEAESDSSMFKVVSARLVVSGEQMSAVLTLSGTGYEKLYMGTPEEAANAPEEDFIFFEEDADGAYTYTIPVEALDRPLTLAAFSTKKQEWYERKLTFLSGSLQASDVSAEGAKETLNAPEDGAYTIEILFEGGSGRAEILSPVSLVVEEGRMTALLQWNSPNYDYMVVGGEKYLPVNTEGDSAFEVPVEALDEAVTVIGDTVAMSKPHEVEYTITFRSETLQPAK